MENIYRSIVVEIGDLPLKSLFELECSSWSVDPYWVIRAPIEGKIKGVIFPPNSIETELIGDTIS